MANPKRTAEKKRPISSARGRTSKALTNQAVSSLATDSSTPKKTARWTVMVYLAGDNNLAEECAFAITEMEQADPSGSVLNNLNVLVQFDPRGSRLPTQRFSVEKDPVAKTMRAIPTKSRPRSSLGETDTGSPKTLVDFVSWGIREYPAYSYMVVLSGHAAGVENSFLLKDENPSGSLGPLDLKDAFRTIKDEHNTFIDIVGLDTCLMSMAEIAYQLRDSAKVLIGSEGYSPLAGWPYRPVLAAVTESIKNTKYDPKLPPQQKETIADDERKELAGRIVRAYTKYYFDFVRGGIDVDQAAIDISKSRDLAELVRALGERMGAILSTRQKNFPFLRALLLAHWDAQSYNGEIYVDLKDFCDRLVERTAEVGISDTQIKNACGKIAKLIYPPSAEGYVLESCYTGPSYQYSHGVSIYFPWYEVFPYYSNLDFSSATDWYKFLEKYVGETRRDPRKVAGGREIGDRTSTLPVRQASGRQASGRDDRPIIRSMRNPPISLLGPTLAFAGDQEVIDKLAVLD